MFTLSKPGQGGSKQAGQEKEEKGLFDQIGEQVGKAFKDQASKAGEEIGAQMQHAVTGERPKEKEAAPEAAQQGFGDMKEAGGDFARTMFEGIKRLPEMLLGGADKGASLMAGGTTAGGAGMGIPNLSSAAPEKSSGKNTAMDLPGLEQIVGVVMNLTKATAPQEMSHAPSLGGNRSSSGAEVVAAFAELAGMGKDRQPTRSKDVNKSVGMPSLEQVIGLAA